MRLDPGSRVRMRTVSLSPIIISQSEWQGRGYYRRPASVVRKVERGFYRVMCVEGGRMIHGGNERLPDIDDRHLAVADVSFGYHSELVPNPGEKMSILVVLVPLHLLAPRLPGSRHIFATAPLDAPAARLAYNVAQFLLEEGEHIAEPLRDQAIDLFLSMVARSLGLQDETENQAPIRSRRLDEIVRFVRDNVANPDLSASVVAESLGISQRYLSLLLQQSSLSFPQLVRRTRVALACELLTAPEMKDYQVSEIGLMAGFKSAPHFARVFKEETGLPPGEYRAASGSDGVPDNLPADTH